MKEVNFFEILILFINFSVNFSYYIEENHHPDIINNFAFGSCFYGRSSTRLDMFKIILKNNPELWVWLGDAAYSDYDLKEKGKIFDYEFSQNIFNISKSNKCKYFKKT